MPEESHSLCDLIQSIDNQNQLQGKIDSLRETSCPPLVGGPKSMISRRGEINCHVEGNGNLSLNNFVEDIPLTCTPKVRFSSLRTASSPARGEEFIDVHKISRKVAFTLAETLITLGIIGVVAAMTLPTVIANYQKHVTVTKLEKAYTTLSQAFKLSEVNNETSEHWDNAFEIGADNYFNKYWKPYLNGVEVCKKYQDCGYNSNTPFYTLKGQVDGVTVGDSSHSRILFRINSDTVYLLFASMGTASITGSQPSNHVWIDINGGKGPNMFGKDVFQFRYVTGEGIVPSGIDYPNYVRTSCSKNQGKGDYCAAKIVQDGWKIADDYPW